MNYVLASPKLAVLLLILCRVNKDCGAAALE